MNLEQNNITTKLMAKTMDKENVTYEQALALHELGFDFGSKMAYGEII